MKRRAIRSRSKSVALLSLILLVIAFCKFTLFVKVHARDPSRIFSPDSASYDRTARAFLETGRFDVSLDEPGVPQIERTPGYPFFIASIFFLFGESYAALIIAQIIVSLGTLIVTYLIAANLWGTQIAVMAVLLLAFDFPSFVSSQKVLTETLFTFVLSIASITGLHALKNPQKQVWWGFCHGALLTFATFIRPIAYYLIIPVGILFTVTWRVCFNWSWKKTLFALAVLLIPWVGMIGGWQLRNYVVAGNAEFSTIQGENLLFYRGAGIIAQRDGISFEEAQQRLGYEHYIDVQHGTTNRSIAQLKQRWRQEGVDLICCYPWLFIKDLVKGGLKMMFMPGEDSFLVHVTGQCEKTGPIKDFFTLPLNTYIQKWVIGKTGYFGLFVLAESYLMLVYLGLLVSLWNVIRTREVSRRVHLFLWLMIVYFIAISIGPGSYYRFRIPIMPLLSVYAGHGLYQMATALRHRKG